METLSFCRSLLIPPGGIYQHSSNKAQVRGAECNRPTVHLTWPWDAAPSLPHYCPQFFRTVPKGVLGLQWLSILPLIPVGILSHFSSKPAKVSAEECAGNFLHYLGAITKRPLLRPSVSSSSEIFAFFHAVPALPASETHCLTFRTLARDGALLLTHPLTCRHSWFWLAVKGKMGGKNVSKS